MKKKSQVSEKRASFSLQDQGGLNEIRDKLFKYRERLAAVRAGQSFEDRLDKEDMMSMVSIITRLSFIWV